MDNDTAAQAQPAPGKLSQQEKLLQYFLLSTTVPFKDGGGVIFPNGFPGAGYRLDEWQFERYRARLDRGTLGEAARHRQRVAFALLIVFVLVVALVSFGAPLLNNHPAIAPYLARWDITFDSWMLFPLLLIAVVMFRRIQRTLLTQAQGRVEPSSFEDTPKVSRFAYLPRRVLGMLASGQVSVTAQHVRVLLGGGLGLLLLALASGDGGIRDENLLAAAILLIYAARPGYFCFIYWSFRRAHGRAPSPADLQPV